MKELERVARSRQTNLQLEMMLMTMHINNTTKVEENYQKQTTENTTSPNDTVEMKQILNDDIEATTPNQRQKNNTENSIELSCDDISDISESKTERSRQSNPQKNKEIQENHRKLITESSSNENNAEELFRDDVFDISNFELQ
jgi:hypothetical protein